MSFLETYTPIIIAIIVLLAILAYYMYKPVENLSEVDTVETNKKYIDYVFGGIPFITTPGN